MFFQPHQHEKHKKMTIRKGMTIKKIITNSNLRKLLQNPAKHLKCRIRNNSNKENNVTAIVNKVSSYQHIKRYNKTLNVLKSLCNNVVVLMSL